ncbi:SAM-dependent methyltransferase [Candidatus Micrarchaeota archaeon]|nr:SAM-dependent methyltransferase [Candidatus Micrarchaeota archaeon]
MVSHERRFFCRSPDGSIIYTTDGSFIFAEKDGVVMRLDMFAGHYYKLRPYNGVPVLEVDGLRMQLVKDFRTPLDYSNEVVKGLHIPESKGAAPDTSVALDTCMGLGYTAIALAKKSGVKMVVTCELSEAVITLAKWNPFSDMVFAKGSKIVLMEGSIAERIKSFDSGMFSYIIHDPPRVSHAPELYSSAFYAELYRVCRKGARIFHYVGSVGKTKGRRIDREVEKRLSAAGFTGIRYVPRLQGMFGTK